MENCLANCLNCKDQKGCMGFIYTPYVYCKYYDPIKEEDHTIKKKKEDNNDAD